MAGCVSTYTPVTPNSIQAYQNCEAPAEGLLPYPGMPGLTGDVDAQYDIVSTRNTPGGLTTVAQKALFKVGCVASLRARGLLYSKATPGDCGRPSSMVQGFSSGQIAGLSGTAASGVIGGLGAAGVLSGAATLGIGTAVTLAVAGISEIFSHHAQAIANEQSTICSVANYLNGLIQQIDAEVASGRITYDQGVTYMKQITNQALTGLSSIASGTNAAVWFSGTVRAHADFASWLYPRISPAFMAAQAPGSSPSTPNNPPGAVPDAGATAPLRSMPDPGYAYQPAIPPGSVPALGNAAPIVRSSAPPLTPNSILPSGVPYGNPSDYLNIGYNQQTGQSAQYADVPPTTTNWTLIGIAVIAGIVAIVVFK